VDGRTVAGQAARRHDARQHGARDVENPQEIVVPIAVEIHQHGARRVRGVGDVQGAAGEIPDEPRVDVAEEQIAGAGARLGVGNVVENPADLAGGKVGVDHQPGLAGDLRAGWRARQLRAEVRRAPALPDDSGSDGPAALPVPHDGGLALVGDPDPRDVRCAGAMPLEEPAGGLDLGAPDLPGILLHPSRLRVAAGDRRGFHPDIAALGVVQGGTRRSGAFIQRKYECHLHPT